MQKREIREKFSQLVEYKSEQIFKEFETILNKYSKSVNKTDSLEYLTDMTAIFESGLKCMFESSILYLRQVPVEAQQEYIQDFIEPRIILVIEDFKDAMKNNADLVKLEVNTVN
ncbi:hypothetical protein HYE60_10920 [Aggregatibacter actinomycetemcomitans]|uniref:hypothetical protein n=1 Tax=Aggregatibacter actinomycetemcomitans TaxID=714 RepID=UPI00197C3636|nr:hypothetical protein [Aggregatibacter actinomycetemcomitans]MBN6075745.1 hypothetical protein [Aggregatibacter actinomycetemcomitans]